MYRSNADPNATGILQPGVECIRCQLQDLIHFRTWCIFTSLAKVRVENAREKAAWLVV
jgi:hypothetical protein